MGIRKGWALSGARASRCLISHAVSSHPLLEQQTEALHAGPPLAARTGRWMPFTGKKKKHPHPSLHLSARDSIAERTTGALLSFITSLAPPAPEDGAPGGTRHHPAYFFFLFLFKLSLLTASVDIISTHANDEDRGGGGIWIHPSSSSSSLIIFFSLGAEGVVCPAETQ